MQRVDVAPGFDQDDRIIADLALKGQTGVNIEGLNIFPESKTTRKVGGLDFYAQDLFPRPYRRGQTKARQCFNIAVVNRPPEAGKPHADLKSTNQTENWLTIGKRHFILCLTIGYRSRCHLISGSVQLAT